jgi:hypothetical protein
MPRGASVPTLTPHHSGTVQPRKGGPLWLQHQAYGYLLTLCQDHARVSATAVLVTLANRVSPHYGSDGMPMDPEDREGQHFLTAGSCDQGGGCGLLAPGQGGYGSCRRPITGSTSTSMLALATISSVLGCLGEGRRQPVDQPARRGARRDRPSPGRWRSPPPRRRGPPRHARSGVRRSAGLTPMSPCADYRTSPTAGPAMPVSSRGRGCRSLR